MKSWKIPEGGMPQRLCFHKRLYSREMNARKQAKFASNKIRVMCVKGSVKLVEVSLFSLFSISYTSWAVNVVVVVVVPAVVVCVTVRVHTTYITIYRMRSIYFVIHENDS